jgi:hypothetical protein
MEFPDAFALATLEVWAKKNDCKVLVVTRDEGCIRACGASEHLVNAGSLTDGLAALRTADAGRKKVIEAFEQLLSTELRMENSELRRQLDKHLEDALDDMDLDINFVEDSGENCEHELTEVRVEQVKPVEYSDGTLELRVFTATKGELSFTCDLQMRVEARAKFAKVFRGNRSPYLSGAPEEHGRGTVDVEAIVTLQPAGTLSAKTLPHAKVRLVELQVTSSDIDFGYIDAYAPMYEE